MTNKKLFDDVSFLTSKHIAQSYSTSFSIGIRLLSKELRDPVYSVYGFVRIADEIVDTFHGFDKATLLEKFKNDTHEAIRDGISTNPVLNSFQRTVKKYRIREEWIETFFKSMEMDLSGKIYTREKFNEYVLGSAEVVGLMCLHIFCEGDEKLFESLKPFAMKLGAAFQKVNFLRDLSADNMELGRAYFPDFDFNQFNENSKKEIEKEIREDFKAGYEGITRLPKHARFGVYLAYVYYFKLFTKICKTTSASILKDRIRIPNKQKYAMLVSSYLKHSFNIL